MAGHPVTLYNPDPRRLFLQAMALLIIHQNVLIDQTGKGNLLRFAGEATIQDLGWLYGPRGDRLQPSFAVTTIEFTLSTQRSETTTIPAGTRIVAGNLTFATLVNLDIPAGETAGSVVAQSLEYGPESNGMLPGQVFQIMDRVPFVDTAVNTTESAGGADLESLEAYRARLRTVPESFSTAGPDGAYEFWAKTTNPGIIDVAVWMPDLDMETWIQLLTEMGLQNLDDEVAAEWYARFMELCRTTGTGPGNVNVVPLMHGGQLPTQDILDAVYEMLNARNIRPLTDFLHVKAPVPVMYDVDFAYFIDRTRATEAVEIQRAVNAAVQNYLEWQNGKIGRAIIPDELTKRCIAAGARRLEIISPVFTVLERGQVAHTENIDVRYGGLEANAGRW
jgi:phage-related baseplate assembly protein